MTNNPTTMQHTSPTLHVTILFTSFVFVAILVLSFLLKVEVVARGQGRVMPISRVQVVEPEFAGRIVAIHAKNGATVSKGDVLIELDPTDANSDLGTITSEQNRLNIEASRINAMVAALLLDANNTKFVSQVQDLFILPDELTGHPFATEQRALIEAEARDLLSSLAKISAHENSNRRSEDVTVGNIERLKSALGIQSERLKTSEKLLKQGTASRSTYLDVQQAYTELERQREVLERELEQKIAERTALDSERQSMLANLRRTLLDRQSQINSRLAALEQEERSARRRVEATRLMSPASGIVDQLNVFTIGGVVQAGSELLRVVPSDFEIELEATFSNQDIGFMKKGQRVNIRLDAYPSERFGYVTGLVSDIAADSTKTTDGQWGFIVRIKPDQKYLKAGSDSYPLRSGMTSTIDVVTDKRRLISYFFAPIIRNIQNAMGEQ